MEGSNPNVEVITYGLYSQRFVRESNSAFYHFFQKETKAIAAASLGADIKLKEPNSKSKTQEVEQKMLKSQFPNQKK